MGERDPVCLIPVDLLKSRVKIIPPIPHTVSMEMPLVVIFYRNLWLRHPHRLLRLLRMKPFPKVFKNLKFLENQETDGNQSRTCEKFEAKNGGNIIMHDEKTELLKRLRKNSETAAVFRNSTSYKTFQVEAGKATTAAQRRSTVHKVKNNAGDLSEE